MSDVSQMSDDDKHWKLVPLTPEYIDLEHSGYVKAITEAFKNPKILNIALSGNFGVGKSSILQKVAKLRKDRVVELSLSTLAPIGEASIEESVPKQATTPTNRIQQEIVKQLLYQEEPNKTPGSRFRRIERFDWWRELAIAFLVGLTIAVIFLLAGWTGQIASELAPLIDLGPWDHLIPLVLASGLTVAVRRLFHGRIYVRQLSTGAATVTLDNRSVSYFDQYLDEIVYFFEVSKRDIVIFEDIDRFNDSHIFETLRSLNTLLNASPQIDKPIRFIYAIKDSIFDRIGLELEGRKFEPNFSSIEDPAKAEAVRANRTKFFDLVIPVVPFITHRSARNLAAKILQEIEHKVDSDLIDLAGRYVPDMRLLKNVRNEFIVFRDRIFSGDGEQLNLSQTDLFGMMLYKSTHLTDFEAIRIGNSKLDELYEVGRNLVVSNIKHIERDVRNIRQRLVRLDGVTTQSVRLGKQLIAHVGRTVRAAQFDERNGQYSFGRIDKSEDDLRSIEFWTEFVQAPDDPVLFWRNFRNANQRLQFTRSDLTGALGNSLEPENWNKADREKLSATLVEHLNNLKFLRGADMGDLIRRPEFLVMYKDSELSFDEIARQLFTEGLAYQLIRAGSINRNFTLYTSTFHGDRVSPAATNFIIHHVERDVMDEHFELESDDVEAVIRERGKSALREPALYNIWILDHLLRTDLDAADIMIQSLARLGEDQKRFVQAYLNSADECIRFVERFSAMSSKIIVYLVNQVELEEQKRLTLVNTALVNLADDVKYQINSVVSEYLMNHHAELDVLKSALVPDAVVKQIGKVFSDAGVRVTSLKPLSETVRQAFVAVDLYEINRENLEIAFGSTASLALDVARKTNVDVYNYIKQNLGSYFSAIDGVSATVDSEELFIPVIQDILDEDADRLDEIIAYASESCIVVDIEDVPNDAWSYLAFYERFPATFSNVSRYINSIGSLDANLARVLASAGKITKHEAFKEENKVPVAKIIISACEHLSSASLRAKLVASLELENWLNVEGIPPEDGELFVQLLKHDIVADDADTYSHLLETDWPTRERFIYESKQFMEYMNPAILKGDVAAFLRSDQIDDAIKTAIADCASEYVKDNDKEALDQLARFAIRNNHQLTIDVVEKLASNGVPAYCVVRLLQTHLVAMSKDQLFRILQSLDGDYPKLTSVGRGKPRIPNTPADCALLETLKHHGIVSTYSVNANSIKVNKRLK